MTDARFQLKSTHPWASFRRLSRGKTHHCHIAKLLWAVNAHDRAAGVQIFQHKHQLLWMCSTLYCTVHSKCFKTCSARRNPTLPNAPWCASTVEFVCKPGAQTTFSLTAALSWLHENTNAVFQDFFLNFLWLLIGCLFVDTKLKWWGKKTLFLCGQGLRTAKSW